MAAPVLPPFAQATSGALGSAVSNTLVYPLDLLSTRLQTQSRGPSRGAAGASSGEKTAAQRQKERGYQSLSGALREIYEKGGVKGLYKGWASDTLSSTLSNFLFFYFRSFLIELVRQRKATAALLPPLYSAPRPGNGSSPSPAKSTSKQAQITLSAAEDLAVGALAGILSRFFTTPLSNVTVRKQTSATSASSSSKDNEKGKAKEAASDSSDEEEAYNDDDGPGIIDTLKEIMQERGVAGLWSGYDTAVLLSIVPALTFYLTNFLSRSFLPTSAQQRPNALQTFATSAGGNALATLLVFPLILSKTRLQWKSPSGKRVYRNLVDVVRKTVRRGGWKGLYQGLNSQLIKGFLSHGVTMMIKQRVERLFVLLYILVRHRQVASFSEKQ